MLRLQFSQTLGGNVMVFSIGSFVAPDVAQTLLEGQLSTLNGVQYDTVTSFCR
ncbi:MAG: hypothetical protein U0694_27150 [Anaerolineae bacterium]